MRMGSTKESTAVERVDALGCVKAQKKSSRRVEGRFLTGGRPDGRNGCGKVKWVGRCKTFSILFVKDFVGGAKGVNM